MTCPARPGDDVCVVCKLAGLSSCPFQGGALPLAPGPKVTWRGMTICEVKDDVRAIFDRHRRK